MVIIKDFIIAGFIFLGVAGILYIQAPASKTSDQELYCVDIPVVSRDINYNGKLRQQYISNTKFQGPMSLGADEERFRKKGVDIFYQQN